MDFMILFTQYLGEPLWEPMFLIRLLQVYFCFVEAL